MDWQACYSTPLEIQAHIVKGYLEHYGVPCLIANDRFGMKPLTFGALGEVHVLVRGDWAHIARGLISGRESARPRWRCLPGGRR
jgi:hypothetical protein